MTEPTAGINKIKLLSAASSGLLLTASFPKIGLDGLAWFALVPLLVSLRTLSVKNGFRLGFLAGMIHYLTLVYWLAYTMKTYGNLPFYISVSILLLMSAYLALYTAAFSAGIAALAPMPLMCIFVIPVFWVSMEYIRSFLLSGFPWEFVGYSQYNRLHIIQISDIIGIYGVSFLIALANGAILLVFLFLTQKQWRGIPVSKCLAAGAGLIFFVFFVLFWSYGKWRIHSIDELISASPSVRVGIVQANIDQARKWDPAFQRLTTEKYLKLSLSAKKDAPELVVWPETATPFYFLRQPDLSKLVAQGIQLTGTDFLIGSPSFIAAREGIDYYNSAYLIAADGTISAKYDKAHLVPFGEYVPLKKWVPFLGKLVENVGDFKAGVKGNTVQWGDYRLGIQICFEIIFPNLSRAMVKNNASLLVNITNDAWFGKTSAPYQHFSMAVFRAVENRRALIRSANTGISGFIDPVGRIIDATPVFEEAVMTRSVPVIKLSTVYTRRGDIFALACFAAGLFFSISRLYSTVKNK